LWHEFSIKAFGVKRDSSTGSGELILGHIDHTWSKCLPTNDMHEWVFVMRELSEMYQFYLHNRFITIIQKIFSLSAVYADDT
jgi:hypothetical protein